MLKMFCHFQLDMQVCLSKFVSQKIFLHCLYTVSFRDFHQCLATRTTATWISLVIFLQYWQFINTHCLWAIISFLRFGLFWEAISMFLRTQSFWNKVWGQVVCYNRISILDIISNGLPSFFTTAVAANIPLLAEDWNASPCFSQHRSENATGQFPSVWSSRLALMWEAETRWHWCPAVHREGQCRRARAKECISELQRSAVQLGII